MSTPFVIGREEWLALPELGVPAIRARIDTGARTSALHAERISLHEEGGRTWVRFVVQPLPGRRDVEIVCSAPVVDRRVVTSSSGDRELRLVIRTSLSLGGRTWPIDVSLTNREHMSRRMLLGRQAFLEDMLVQPGSSFRQPRLGTRAYKGLSATGREGTEEGAPRSAKLVISLISRRPDNASNVLLQSAAEARGHTIEALDRRRVSLFIDPTQPALLTSGAPLGRVDAVIARSGTRVGSFSLAIQRHLEHQGAFALNPALALRQMADPLAVRQHLADAHLPVAAMAVSATGQGADSLLLADAASLPRGALVYRLLVVAGRVVAALVREQADPDGLDPGGPDWRKAEPGTVFVETAEVAARVLGLGLAAVDVADLPRGPLLADVSPAPALAIMARVAGVDVAARIIEAIESASGGTAPASA